MLPVSFQRSSSSLYYFQSSTAIPSSFRRRNYLYFCCYCCGFFLPAFSLLQTSHRSYTSNRRNLPLITTKRHLSTPTSTPRTKMMPSKAEIFYEPYRKHPELFQNHFLESWLHPDMMELVSDFQKYYTKNQTKLIDFNTTDNDDEYDIGDTLTLRDSMLDEKEAMKISSKLYFETKGVYSFDCFNDDFLNMMNDELSNFYKLTEQHNVPIRRPNSMNNYGVILNEIGMKYMISSLQQQYIWPIARVLFPKEGSQFNDHHSFIVRYQSDEDLGLDMHTDDSDVTFNVCLGDKGFTGATLVFCGMFGQGDHRQYRHTYHHKVGRAVLHLGSQRHGADDIDSGTRVNWIVWNHNNKYRHTYEYKIRMTSLAYEQEHAPPSKVCLSYTHDRDYKHYHETLPKAADGLHLHPWCPPPGKEYDGYGKVTLREKIHDPNNEEKKEKHTNYDFETHPNEI